MTSKKDKKQIIICDGITMDSTEELHTYWWLKELKELGYIESIERSHSFTLSSPLKLQYIDVVQMKTKVKQVSKIQTLLRGQSYCPDYKIIWSQKGADVFVHRLFNQVTQEFDFTRKFEKLFIGEILEWQRESDKCSYVSYIEVKKEFSPHNMERVFKINQNTMWEAHRVFVNLVIPLELFPKTFVPKEFLITPTGRNKKMNYEFKVVEQFLNI